MAMAKNRLYQTTKITEDFTLIEKNESITQVLIFLEKSLVLFAIENTNIDFGNEGDINQKLCIFLQRNTNQNLEEEFRFIFQSEYKERGSNRRVDIGVIQASIKGRYRAFFTIECKRLPAPAPQCREKEYVYGEIETKYEKLGGIERFKREHHGKGLSHSAIVAYVEKHDFCYWFETINSWINELCKPNSDTSIIWNEEDLLVKQYEKETLARYESENYRINNDAIKLTHLWIKMYDNF